MNQLSCEINSFVLKDCDEWFNALAMSEDTFASTDSSYNGKAVSTYMSKEKKEIWGADATIQVNSTEHLLDNISFLFEFSDRQAAWDFCEKMTENFRKKYIYGYGEATGVTVPVALAELDSYDSFEEYLEAHMAATITDEWLINSQFNVLLQYSEATGTYAVKVTYMETLNPETNARVFEDETH